MKQVNLDIESFSSTLDWKQFEGLADLTFRSFGYNTFKNYRIKKPRSEIDLLAISKNISFAVDCKHWKRTVGHATMLSIANNQVHRCERLIQARVVDRIIPLVLTWRDESLNVLENGVPIVPIQKISDFILNWNLVGSGILIMESRKFKNMVG